MDWLTFTSELIKAAVSWPVAIFAVFYLFRNELRSLVSKLARLKIKDWEFDFTKELELTVIQAEKSLPPEKVEVRSVDYVKTLDAPAVNTANISEDAQIIMKMVKRYAPAAILAAWFVVEHSLREAAARHEIPDSDRAPTLKLAEELHRRGVIAISTFEIFKQVRDLRNKVVHLPVDALSASQAAEYEALAIRLAAIFKKV